MEVVHLKEQAFLIQQEDEWRLIQRSIQEFPVPSNPELRRTIQDYLVSADRLAREELWALFLTGSALPDNKTYHPSDDDIHFGTLPQPILGEDHQFGEGFSETISQSL